MKTQAELRSALEGGLLDRRLEEVYGVVADIAEKRQRFRHLLQKYTAAFGYDEPVALISAPGRTELGGNHTDHQHGRVLAAAVDADAIACAGKSGGDEIRILSAGYPDIVLSAKNLAPVQGEEGSSAALVRGICSRIAGMGYKIGGFHACIVSDVPGGSGLSSSAAYEVLIGVIVNHLFCDDALTAVEIAQIGQYAENVFFGKPCGLMDQLTSAVGGVLAIDFQDPKAPVVEKLEVSPADYGYVLCIVNSGADHADLTEEYAAIPAEMGAVARQFGKDVLREVDEEAFFAAIPALREAHGDRAVLRAVHFFAENRVAAEEATALANGDFERFLELVRRSGRSSAMYLQNLSCAAFPRQQALSVAIATAEHFLRGIGAARVHGGGFAGTIQAYVPMKLSGVFLTGMESVLGKGCCHFLWLRAVGGTVLA